MAWWAYDKSQKYFFYMVGGGWWHRTHYAFFLIIYKSKLFLHSFFYVQTVQHWIFLSLPSSTQTHSFFWAKETSKSFYLCTSYMMCFNCHVERFNLLYTFNFFLHRYKNNHKGRDREEKEEVDDYDIILTSLINSVKVSTTPRRIVEHVATRAIKTRSIRTWRACGWIFLRFKF